MSTLTNVLKDLREAQQSDYDGRNRAREADHFVNKKDGQWEPDIAKIYDKKPKYTFDKCSGVVADICGEMNSMDFSCVVKPSGGAATTQMALHYDGILRNIQNNSGEGAKYIYRGAGRQMVTTGIGGWRIVVDWREPTSWQQSLIIKPVSNFMDRVWFDPGAEERSMSDANYGFCLTSMTMDQYKIDFPKGKGASVGRDNNYGQVYYYKKSNEVIVGEYYKKVDKKVDLMLMSNDSVYIVDDKFLAVKDELAAQNIKPVDARSTTLKIVHHRLFDGNEWLTKDTETVFDYIPLVPCFANYELSEDKVIYWGAIEKIMDSQRVLNYAESRKIEEGALAPRAKKWMTKEQMQGHETTLASMNTNADPVQAYNFIADQPQPFETGGAQINPGLAETAQAMNAHIMSISNKMDPTREGARGLQSGVALDAINNKSDTGNYEYFTAMEVAIAHTCRILVNAIPKVHDAKQEMRLDQQDGTTKTITVNDPILDQQSGKVINLNDLSAGQYNVTCSAGPAFNNRQEQTVKSLTEIAKIDPTILQLGSDVFLNNIPSPGIDKVADRKRLMMVKEGVIPEEQLTDEEKQMMAQIKQQQEQNPAPPSPEQQAMMVAAQAEDKKAQADLIAEQVNQGELNAKVQKDQADAQFQRDKLMTEASLRQSELALKAFEAETARMKLDIENERTDIMQAKETSNNMVQQMQASAKMIDSITKRRVAEKPDPAPKTK